MRKLRLPDRTGEMPKLGHQDIKLINDLGMDNIQHQAKEIVSEKLTEAQADPKMPAAGNPVYKGMHACRATSRNELKIAHGIPAEKKLSDTNLESVVNLLSRWIAREYNFYKKESDMKQTNINSFSEE
jgi:hypothetical protein